MDTLKTTTMMTVIKQGIPKSELPKTVAREVEKLEERIKSDWTGIFRIWHLLGDHINIKWSGEEWRFQFYWFRPRPYMHETPDIKIRAGRTNDLGYAGGIMFLMPGKRVWINDYRVCADGRQVIFYGVYSSTTMATSRQFKATLSLSGDQNRLRMEVV
eukprot:GFUD01007187.1.p1 GENE.GFUD01007187.1~~GFUD01007187.1.p1  ORF type:complete len:166 (-),score=15.75 GFUD01007187.1:84-557(-)